MERRRSAVEVGITAVQCLEGEAVWQAAVAGRWSVDLGLAALAVVDSNEHPAEAPARSEQQVATGGGAVGLAQLRAAVGAEATIFLLEYSDGFGAALLHAGGAGATVGSWAYAGQVKGEPAPLACNYSGNGSPNYPPFSYLGLNIEQMFITGQPQYPVERTCVGQHCLLSTTSVVVWYKTCVVA